MRKMIVFTEGQTEQIFVRELLRQVALETSLQIDSVKQFGGARFPVVEYRISSVHTSSDSHSHYALLFDCGSDGRVVSSINDRYDRLIEENFEFILAVRDVRPEFTYEQVSQLRSGMESAVRSDPVTPKVCLATMEAETWFIAEYTHFQRMAISLTERALGALGLDLTANLEQLPEPAKSLQAIYDHAGLIYDKSRAAVERTVAALDMHSVVHDLPIRVPSITPLVASIESFLRADTGHVC